MISEYLCEELPLGKANAISAHLSDCHSCQSEAQAMKRALAALQAPKREFEPPNVLDAVKNYSEQRRLQPIAIWVTAGALAILMIWIGISAMRPPHVQHPNVIAQNHVTTRTEKLPKTETASNQNAGDIAPKAATVPKHTQPRKPTRLSPKQRLPIPPKPIIECVIVYTPAPMIQPTSEPEYIPSTDTETVSYSIRMMDETSGEVKAITARTEIEPGKPPTYILEYGTSDSDDSPNGERSSVDDDTPMCIHNTDFSCAG